MIATATIAYPIQDSNTRRPTLFRAFCHSSASRLEHYTPGEETVFIDAVDRDDAARRITQLLAILWHVPADSIGFYNLSDENELFEQLGNDHGGDVRLFEAGWCGAKGALYFSESHMPYLLVRPETVKRLKQAWASIPADAWRGVL
ncbi:hypothetical protein [Noviherbaspirillum aerium]|uniref:hypothetical protein n=1 Tax=Noviherbaspirillum aerium TaxID=2588497 RepID=UPI00124E7DF6|nr:hypothetical protein [Noviherbaspirillum aerium]